jgi:hypothetical protein
MYNQEPAIVIDGSARELNMVGFKPVRDDQKRRNKITAKRPFGGEATYTHPSVDPTHPDYDVTKGVYDSDLSVNPDSDDRLIDHAALTVEIGMVPGKRYPSVIMDLLRCPQLVGAWRATQLGDLIRITVPPQQHAKGDVDLLIRGYRQTWSGGRKWLVEMNTVRADPYRVQVIEGAGNTGRLAPAGVTLSTTYEATVTSMVVSIAAGNVLLSTAGADYPAAPGVLLDIGGECVGVTAVSGASSPQTMTVVRSINGVRKRQLSGTAVNLWQPSGLAL